MAYIELIVKIDANVYTRLFDNGIQDNEIVVDDVREMARALRLGIPLPKGHGRLIDADALNRKDVNCANVPMNFIDIAPTIVEADKVEREAIEELTKVIDDKYISGKEE